MLDALFQYQFMQNAFLAGIMASIVCGFIGVMIVEKKLVMLTGGIAHTSYGGVGLGYLLGFEPIYGAFLISVMASLGIGYLKRKGSMRSDLIIGMFWSFGMALGILFIGLMPGYPPQLSSYLFGSILSVTYNDLFLMAILTLVVVLVIIMLFDYWKAYMFDEEFAAIKGIKTAFLDYLLFVLIALAVVVLIRVVGIILILALFTAPTAISVIISKNLKSRMIISVAVGVVFSISGLWLSYLFNTASGATIVIISVIGYLLVYMVHMIKIRVRRRVYQKGMT